MSVHTEFDQNSLIWVKGELEQTLSRAATALRQFGSDQDAAALAQAQICLHQATGALQMVELQGLARYCEETERVAAGVAREGADHHALDAVLAATDNITRYLDRLAAGAPNVPLLLRDELVSLATLRGESITGAELFFPQLEQLVVPADFPVHDVAEADLPARIKQQRARYESGLLRWLRANDAEGAVAMAKSLAAMASAQSSMLPRAFWWSAAALVDGLPTNQSTPDLDPRLLLMRLNLQLRSLVDGSAVITERLFRDVLYLLAHDRSQSRLALRVKQAFELESLLVGDDKAPALPSCTHTVHTLRQALSHAQEVWSHVAAGQEERLPQLTDDLARLAQGCEALNIVGLAPLWQGMSSMLVRCAGRLISEAEALELATAMLLADSALLAYPEQSPDFPAQADAMVQRLVNPVIADHNLPPQDAVGSKRLLAQLAQEIRSSLHTIEDTLDAFFRDTSQRAALTELEPALNQVHGALIMLDCQDAVALLVLSHERIQALAAATAAPATAELEELADAFATLGFYVDGLEHGHDDSATLLHPMLARLSGEAPALEPEYEPGAAETALEIADETTDNTTAPAATTVIEPVASLLQPAAHEDTVDAELLHVYLEEATAVLATIASQLDTCHHTSHSGEALTLIRRAFHTLKGSGRMVGLFDLGETARAVEQLLNTWLQTERPATPELLALLGDAHDAFQSWVGQLAESGYAHVEATALVARAEALRQQLQQGAAPETPERVAPPLAATPQDAVPEVAVAAEVQSQPEEQEAAPEPEQPAPVVIPKLEETMVGDVSVSMVLLDIFCDEAAYHLRMLEQGGQALQQGDAPAPAFLLAAHTLGGIAATAGFGSMGDLAYALEHSAQKSYAAPVEPLITAVERLGNMLQSIVARQGPGSGIPEIAALASRDALFADEPQVATAAAQDEAAAEAPYELAQPELSATAPFEPDIAEDEALPGPDFLDLDEFELTEPTAEELADLALLDSPLPQEHDVSPELESAALFVPTSEPEAEPAETLALHAHDVLLQDIPSEQATVHANLDEGHAPASSIPAVPDIPAPEAAAQDIAVLSMEDDTEEELVLTSFSQALLKPFTAQEAKEPPLVIADLAEPEPVADAALPQASAAFTPAMEDAVIDAAYLLEPVAPTDIVAEEAQPGVVAQPESIMDAVVIEPVATAEPEHLVTEEAQYSTMPAGESESSLSIDLDPIVDPDVSALGPLLTPLLTPLLIAHDAPEPIAGLSHSLTERKAALGQTTADEIDEQLLAVFVEEGDELLPQVGVALRALRAGEPTDLAVLKRILHTLKGSARMVGAMRMGEATHHMESLLPISSTVLSEPVLDELDTDYDLISQLFDEVAGRTGEPSINPDVATPEAEGISSIRVRAELVDSMVNQAGEVSIARSRVESEILALKGSLLDLTDNVTRLRTQMRELEIQTESQMQARTREYQEAGQTFDPLEFDRFTRLQEVTRSIAESVNDVASIQHNLLKNVDESVAALSTQARTTKDLQQSLMRVRMVPFSSIADRLYRATRSTGKEVGKKVNLELHGSRVDIDRSVLERMISPFEHMLRNAIDHGLEAPAERVAAGKNELGEVQIEVRQEGNELVVIFKDDGKGLDIERIRAKALESGLIEPAATVTEHDLMQLIFEPGFSTASNITQISGRGIGMDVVKNEIGNLGGRIDVGSEPGEGTCFTIHLPLTLAVTQVLLIKSAGQQYAIPAVMIEQVQELKQDALARLYENRAQEWQGEHYPFSYLPRLLGDGTTMPETRRFSTVLLLRTGANRMALHVDELVKNQEVVVKPIGPQLAHIPGVAGSTVLGNGEIVLIMNPLALLAHGEVATQAADPVTPAPEQLHTTPVIMVVDDSLTVRKIASRLLTREGYQVVMAKDGVEALQQLQEVKPAVILLDIEMPRMDGFELTRNLRANTDTHDIPIIMITSRTADKHRSYAAELGVNVFMGKPYQEDELLQYIRSFIPA